MKNRLYILIITLLITFGFAPSVSAQVSIQGSRGDWVPAGIFEYDNNRKPFHDIQYDSVPNHSWYYQVDVSPTYFLTGTGNNYNPSLTPQILMDNLSFWGIQKGSSASYDTGAELVVTSPVTPTVIGGNLFNSSLREIGITSNGVDVPLFSLDGLGLLNPINTTIEPGSWKFYSITEGGRRKDGSQQVYASFLDTQTGQIYLAFNSFNFWGFSGLFVRLDPIVE